MADLGNLTEALVFYHKSFSIKERDLIPQHHDLLELGNRVALAAMELGDYQTALVYARKMIKNDPAYKYAIDTEGLILHKQGNLQEALTAFDQALECDPGYADAYIHKLEVISEKETFGVELAVEEFLKTQVIQKSDYDERKKEELRIIVSTLTTKEKKGNVEVEIPKQKFETGSLEFFQMIDAVKHEFDVNLNFEKRCRKLN